MKEKKNERKREKGAPGKVHLLTETSIFSIVLSSLLSTNIIIQRGREKKEERKREERKRKKERIKKLFFSCSFFSFFSLDSLVKFLKDLSSFFFLLSISIIFTSFATTGMKEGERGCKSIAFERERERDAKV